MPGQKGLDYGLLLGIHEIGLGRRDEVITSLAPRYLGSESDSESESKNL